MAKTKQYYLNIAGRAVTGTSLIVVLYDMLTAYSRYSGWQKYCCCLCLCCFTPKDSDFLMTLVVGDRKVTDPNTLLEQLNRYWGEDFKGGNKALLLGEKLVALLEAIDEVLQKPHYASACAYRLNWSQDSSLVFTRKEEPPPSYNSLGCG